jgi:lipopolysaccharide/colanic/teichoic acid biosynthesis glycosyltransferase
VPDQRVFIVNKAQISIYQRFGKRLFDLLVTAPGFVLVLPLVVLTWLCSLVFLGQPVLFKQRRAGYKGRPFILYKFRSMVEARGECGEPLPDVERLTTYGRLLRSTSVDELPGLWNVLQGDMSLIGPRPLPVEYCACYTDEQAQRLDAVPGLAGYAALFGRNAQSWESIFQHDVWYVQHVSFGLDLRTICGLVGVVLRREGIDRGSHDCGSPFAERLRAGVMHEMGEMRMPRVQDGDRISGS